MPCISSLFANLFVHLWKVLELLSRWCFLLPHLATTGKKIPLLGLAWCCQVWILNHQLDKKPKQVNAYLGGKQWFNFNMAICCYTIVTGISWIFWSFIMLVGLLPVTAGVVNTNGFPVLVVHVFLFKMATCHYIHVTGIRRICSSFQILLINNGLLCTLSSHYLCWGSHSYDHHGKQSTNSRFLLRNRVVYHKFVASSC